MIAAAQAEALVARHAPRMIRDAEALACTVILADYPQGIAVIEPASRSRDAWSVGSGHNLAVALGCRRRPAAVIVGAEARLRDAVAYYGTRAAHEAKVAAQADIEATALHEAAHAVVAPLDRPSADEPIVAYRNLFARPLDPESHERRVASHRAEWAAAYVVLVGRALRFRPAVADALRAAARDDIADYGIQFDRVAEAAAGVPFGASLRELVADAGFMRDIGAAIPGNDERLAIVADDIARAGVPSMRSLFDEVKDDR